eukprot:6202660-Pleurochrysis_carterae.AAC.1
MGAAARRGARRCAMPGIAGVAKAITPSVRWPCKAAHGAGEASQSRRTTSFSALRSLGIIAILHCAA